MEIYVNEHRHVNFGSDLYFREFLSQIPECVRVSLLQLMPFSVEWRSMINYTVKLNRSVSFAVILKNDSEIFENYCSSSIIVLMFGKARREGHYRQRWFESVAASSATITNFRSARLITGNQIRCNASSRRIPHSLHSKVYVHLQFGVIFPHFRVENFQCAFNLVCVCVALWSGPKFKLPNLFTLYAASSWKKEWRSGVTTTKGWILHLHIGKLYRERG